MPHHSPSPPLEERVGGRRPPIRLSVNSMAIPPPSSLPTGRGLGEGSVSVHEGGIKTHSRSPTEPTEVKLRPSAQCLCGHSAFVLLSSFGLRHSSLPRTLPSPS